MYIYADSITHKTQTSMDEHSSISITNKIYTAKISL